MMEEDQSFLCKFCNKTFVNGKCLGDHMRGHLALLSAQKTQENDNGNTGFQGYGLRQSHKKLTEQSDEEEEETNKNSSIGSEDGYGLRENPKKSWPTSGSKSHVCKECKKGFPSMRSLSGHMRCHSIKAKEENICKTCGKGFDSIRALFGHMKRHSKRSDYERPLAIPKKRIKTRYNMTKNPSSSDSNASSSSVLTDTNEVEEVGLNMLSTGDQNPVVCEAQSCSKIKDKHDSRVSNKKNLGSIVDYDLSVENYRIAAANCFMSSPLQLYVMSNITLDVNNNNNAEQEIVSQLNSEDASRGEDDHHDQETHDNTEPVNNTVPSQAEDARWEDEEPRETRDKQPVDDQSDPTAPMYTTEEEIRRLNWLKNYVRTEETQKRIREEHDIELQDKEKELHKLQLEVLRRKEIERRRQAEADRVHNELEEMTRPEVRSKINEEELIRQQEEAQMTKVNEKAFRKQERRRANALIAEMKVKDELEAAVIESKARYLKASIGARREREEAIWGSPIGGFKGTFIERQGLHNITVPGSSRNGEGENEESQHPPPLIMINGDQAMVDCRRWPLPLVDNFI